MGVGVFLGGVVTWAVTHYYSRRQEKLTAALPQLVVRELVKHGVIAPEKEMEARAVAQKAFVSWGHTQAEMNQGSYQEFERADLELRHVLERLRPMLEPDDLKRLEEAQEAWYSFRDKNIKFAGGFYDGGSIRPLVHSTVALTLTEARKEELQRLYDELQSR